MPEGLETLLELLLPFAIVIIGQLIRASRRGQAETEQPTPASQVRPDVAASAASSPTSSSSVIVPVTQVSPPDEQLDVLVARSARLAQIVTHEPANRRFLKTLEDYIPAQVAQARSQPSRARRILSDAEWVLRVVQKMAKVRRDPRHASVLAEADRLAEACYEPVLGFARERNLPLASHHPTTVIGNFHLSTWVGLIPTSVAPIFLPRDFFQVAAWWPAVAHEIGHDFLAAVEGLEDRLRADLGLASYEVSGRPLGSGQMSATVVNRVCGRWLEEIFSDLYGTLSLGPAYLASMVELFARPEDAVETLMVRWDRTESNALDTHPPRHLRVRMVAQILRDAGLGDQADELEHEWLATHGFVGEDPGVLIFPGAFGGYLQVDSRPFEKRVYELADRLRRGPLPALSGYGLTEIVGLDFGPHRQKETDAARQDLMEGQVPEGHDPRALVAGTVWAAREAPERELEILGLARRAIDSLVGRGRMRAARAGSVELHEPAPADDSPTADTIVAALVLGEILSPPRQLGPRS